ncbi:rhomboid family intramembrane serine protease [Aquibacillus rhizosphaerae]|uniref:Rhomboid family intramembrane serine protease n=1 Tax=Aquibacillus rhizosphaerae TaxID=3051431 RepID=A0ABT7L0Y8_9BACI|nr:rhomboid family intramembrane serine protease [Aquibacillus sp. LR5S19]MDL4839458.1 rhomboid family intramembrane serine protease [Aquibacillus sp. LR5S19]
MLFLRNETFKEYIQDYLITSLIVGTIIVTFLITSFLGALTNPEIVYHIGGLDKYQIINEKQYYRFFTYAFLHVGISHLLLNLLLFVIAGPPVEKQIGRVNFLILFISTVLFSAIICFIFTDRPLVGSSGFGYGILGILTWFVMSRNKIVDKESKSIIILSVIMSFIFTLTYSNASILGHISGFIMGIFIGGVIDINRRGSRVNN